MKVVLAEKPSVARDLAAYLKAKSKHEGYFEGEGYQVTWSYGHLVGLKDPEEYDPTWKAWKLETLPIVPVSFELKTLKERGAKQQFDIIRRLFRQADQIIGATDAGREGELIFRYILALTGCERKPLFRVWLSSLTPKAIGQAFAQMHPASDYDNLYAAARCRSEADWIVGLNATRNYTVRFGGFGQLWSAGRVQTPVLSLLVDRDNEIRTFRSEPFWELMTRYREVTFRFAGDRFSKEADAQVLFQKVQGQPFVVRGIEKKEERLNPPRLYDLTELQRDMNRRYGLSAQETLQIAQALYEHKLITYPRTDSRYLSTALKPEVPKILEKLRPLKPVEIGTLNLNLLPFNASIINDKKVTDHHAIIPTGNISEKLSFREQQVFDALLVRLIAVFYPVCIKEVTTVKGDSALVPFQAKGVRVKEPGWTALYPRKEKSAAEQKHEPSENEVDAEGEEDSQSLPEFVKGETGPHKPFVREGKTKPPPHFTENTLLGAMETAGKLVDDESLKDALKERGLGTPATRASIIETLLKRGYIARQKKNLIATDHGRYLVAVIQDAQLKSAELTGDWEAKLRQIEAGRLRADAFMREIEEYTQSIVRQNLSPVDETQWGRCPRCGKPIIEGKRGYGCSGWKEGCPFVLWREFRGQDLTPDQIRTLLQRGAIVEPVLVHQVPMLLTLTKTGAVAEVLIPQAENQTKSKFRKSKRNGKAQGEPESHRNRSAESEPKAKTAAGKPLGKCPLCQSDVLEQPKSFGCSGWREGCKFTIWKTIAAKRITAATAKTLLKNGETSLLKGFKSKAGKPFDAKLKLENGEVKFVFEE